MRGRDNLHWDLAQENLKMDFWYKVKILWEGHKIWKNILPVLAKQLFLLSSVKTSGRFFQIFVAFSEKLDFKQVTPFIPNHICFWLWTEYSDSV